MSDIDFQVGERVKVHLDSKFWKSKGWFEGTVVRVDPYSEHRNFYWVELDAAVEAAGGVSAKVISVFNLKHIKKI